MKAITIKELQHSFFEKMEEFLQTSTREFRKQGINFKDMEIYAPEYLVQMWWSFQAIKRTEVDFPARPKWCDIPVQNNYQDSVVVSYKNLILDKQKPFVLMVVKKEIVPAEKLLFNLYDSDKHKMADYPYHATLDLVLDAMEQYKDQFQ